MKTIGLIGGMSWESTATYYRLLNELARQRLGGLHSASLLLYSFDFAEIEALQAAGDWHAAGLRLGEAAGRLEAGGADLLILCTNTMHKVADAIAAVTTLPLLHIADATGAAVARAGCRRPALLATRYTMEQDFYKARLSDRHGLECLIPDEAGRDLVHRIIYDELCQGIVRPESKAAYLHVLTGLRAAGADSVILGCTEVGLLIGPGDTDLPVFDTTRIHAEAAMDAALSDDVYLVR